MIVCIVDFDYVVMVHEKSLFIDLDIFLDSFTWKFDDVLLTELSGL
jgi:hypothetical protein